MTFVKAATSVQKLHFVAIDGTDPDDAVAFAMTWQSTFRGKWSNLADIVLNGAQQKLVPGQPLLQSVKSKSGASGAACIVPQGAAPKLKPNKNLKDQEIISGNEYLRRWILAPGAGGNGLNDQGTKGPEAYADLVFISSHGYRSGVMLGDSPIDSVFFDAASVADLGLTFDGPKWLFLSNCNALGRPVHGKWKRLMTGGSTLRGIIGFEGLFPDPATSAIIYDRFIMLLSRGQSFKKAWQDTIAGWQGTSLLKNWVVICNEEAINDTVQTWNTKGLLPPKSERILVCNWLHPEGEELTVPNRRFDAFWYRGQNRAHGVMPANRNREANKLHEGDAVGISIGRPSGYHGLEPQDEVRITFVYVRPDYPQLIDIDKMFEIVSVKGSKLDGQHVRTAKLIKGPKEPQFSQAEKDRDKGNDSWVIKVTDSVDAIQLGLRCRPGGLSMLKPREEPVWLRVEVIKSPARLLEDFEEMAMIVSPPR